MKITGSEFDHLRPDQKDECEAILLRGIAGGTVVVLNKAFLPEDRSLMDVTFILAQPADVIQRKFVAKMDKLEDLSVLNDLIEQEKLAETPRPRLLNLLTMKIETIKLAIEQKKGGRSLEDQFFDQIQEGDEDVLLDIKPPKSVRR